ncbi:DUF6122 family protein [Marivirga aurantiaca]|uniref:DUF6122 family protein n=1 Tax=Marivirga aurantiaca TaxID=2802615 RepID=UPI0021D2268F|nr:DUF6122 family protein [Marivirga aurantiaca]
MWVHFVHYGLHFLFPIIIAYMYSPGNWKRVYLILLSTMLIDLDHLLANPIFDPNRCSIGFHPLHSYFAIVVYFLMLFTKKTRILGIGLLFHILTDYLDCFLRS